MWRKESLYELVRQKLQGYQFIVVSNREPHIHSYAAREVEVPKPTSGLTAAMDQRGQRLRGRRRTI